MTEMIKPVLMRCNSPNVVAIFKMVDLVCKKRVVIAFRRWVAYVNAAATEIQPDGWNDNGLYDAGEM